MATNDWSGVHPQAIVDPSAKLADNVTVGPWSYIGPGVEIGEGTEILSHVVIKGPTVIGRNNRIFQFSSIGEECQDKKYAGELTTLVIGDDNVIRENCTIHRGTIQDRGETRIGNGNLLMAVLSEIIPFWPTVPPWQGMCPWVIMPFSVAVPWFISSVISGPTAWLPGAVSCSRIFPPMSWPAASLPSLMA